MDWSDEAKARLEEEEKRLRLKAANLQERHGAWSLMAKQELVVANDISAALEEIEQRGERLAQWEREEVTRAANCCGQEERAEAAEAAHREAAAQWQDESRLRREAEAKLAEAEAEHPTGVCLERELRAERDKLRRDLDRKDHEVAELRDKVEMLLNQNREIAASNADHVRWHREKEAEIERLRGVLGLVLTETGLQAHKHGCPERLLRPAQWDQTLPCAGCAAEAALRTEKDR